MKEMAIGISIINDIPTICNLLRADNCLHTSTYILINIERVSKHSGTILGMRVVTTC